MNARYQSIIWILVILCTCFMEIGCLRCYSCSGSESTSECVTDYEGLQDTRKYYTDEPTTSDDDLNPDYSKDCSIEQNETYCMTERFESFGNVVTYIRDCSDGIHFSIINATRLENIRPTNQTKCVSQQLILFCVTLCEGDFCNGPATGHIIAASTAAISVTFMMVQCIFSY